MRRDRCRRCRSRSRRPPASRASARTASSPGTTRSFSGRSSHDMSQLRSSPSSLALARSRAATAPAPRADLARLPRPRDERRGAERRTLPDRWSDEAEREVGRADRRQRLVVADRLGRHRLRHVGDRRRSRSRSRPRACSATTTSPSCRRRASAGEEIMKRCRRATTRRPARRTSCATWSTRSTRRPAR